MTQCSSTRPKEITLYMRKSCWRWSERFANGRQTCWAHRFLCIWITKHWRILIAKRSCPDARPGGRSTCRNLILPLYMSKEKIIQWQMALSRLPEDDTEITVEDEDKVIQAWQQSVK